MKKLLFALAALSAAAPLAASERDTRQMARIHYGDLDLTSSAGNATLDRRIKVAVDNLCSEDQQLGIARRLAEIRCLRSAAKQVEAQRALVLAQAQARTTSREAALVEQPGKPASSTN